MASHLGDEPPDALAPTGVTVADERAVGPPVDLERLRSLAAFVVAERHVPPAMELGVICVDSATMAELNATHMGRDGPTDVLAFPIDAPDEPGAAMLGDVVLCPQIAWRQTEAGESGDDELAMLLVHGILHLLGYDHEEEDERAVMLGLTDRLLTTFAERPR